MSANRSFLGVHGAARSWLTAGLLREYPRVVVVTRDRQALDEYLTDLAFFDSHTTIRAFTGWETLPYEEVSPQLVTSAERLHTLFQLAAGSPGITIAPADALIQRVIPRALLEKMVIRLERGQTL